MTLQEAQFIVKIALSIVVLAVATGYFVLAVKTAFNLFIKDNILKTHKIDSVIVDSIVTVNGKSYPVIKKLYANANIVPIETFVIIQTNINKLKQKVLVGDTINIIYNIAKPTKAQIYLKSNLLKKLIFELLIALLFVLLAVFLVLFAS